MDTKLITCSVDGCNREVCAKGWCQAHYRRFKTWGDVCADRPIDYTRKLNAEKAKEIRRLLGENMSQNSLAKKFGVHRRVIRLIKDGEIYKGVV